MPAIEQIIPVVKVSRIEAALEFYCGDLGFERRWVVQSDPERRDPAYAGIQRDGLWLHLSSHGGDGVSGAVTNLAVDDVDAYHEEFRQRGVTFRLEPTYQTWGSREMYLDDPDGNKLRFGNWLSC